MGSFCDSSSVHPPPIDGDDSYNSVNKRRNDNKNNSSLELVVILKIDTCKGRIQKTVVW